MKDGVYDHRPPQHNNSATIFGESHANCHYTAIGDLSQMQKLQIKRNSFLIEPANQPTETFVGARSPRPSTKSTLLETISEIVSLIAGVLVGLLALVVL